jgi:ribosomal protein S18 acetylase RimI-like enzyme
MEIRPFEDDDEDAVVELWSKCGLIRPWNDPHKDIDRKRKVQRELFLVGTIDNRLVASVMVGYEGHRGWINYLAVDPNHRRMGLGRALMEAAEQELRNSGCPKINLQIRKDNLEAIAFYEQLGYTDDLVVSYGKRLENDEA